MARGFNGTTQYLSYDPLYAGTNPFSMACWFYPQNNSGIQVLMSTADSGVSSWHYHFLSIRGDLAGDPIAAGSNASGTAYEAQSSSGITTNTWHHACGVWATNSNRVVYLDGGNKGTETTNVNTFDGLEQFALGVLWRTQSPNLAAYYEGYIAEAAVWDVALTDAEAAILAAGYSPLFVRPQSIRAYWPLIRGSADRVGGFALTEHNAPTVEDQSPVIYPYGYSMPGVVSAAPVATLRTLAT